MALASLDQQLEKLWERADHLGEQERQEVAGALVPYVLDRCAKDGWFWLRFVRTRDEADPQNSVKPFPTHLGYLYDLWHVLTTSQRVVIAKSRQMLVSWIMAAYCCWVARFTANSAIYWQSQQYDDAVAMVAMPTGGYRGRCQFIEETLEPWMRQNCRYSEGRIQYPNGSIIQALAGGADKVRGKVISVYVGDEFAHQQDQDGVMASILPLVQKGARAILVSTPNGLNTFATMWHGYPVGASVA